MSAALPDSARRPAGTLLRIAAAAYEGVLLFGVLFVVSYLVLSLARWDMVLTGARLVIYQSILFLTLGAYFVYQWHKTGQTLAMKSWYLRVLDDTGAPPSLRQCVVRYVAAWHPLIPALLCKLAGLSSGVVAVAIAAGLVAAFVPARFDARGRLLHDRLAGTWVARER